ncbi:MAG: hypothetical protein A3J24_09340 [Deltaproteobacteria bacterium RIFCSPLOWO2_02_FULL_53_8]|nr:MAG: hypothetical protein A3J24_09340 [Deltaproteobacteria bacterium RIFCSPLOWO2_02_FULL_53_8]
MAQTPYLIFRVRGLLYGVKAASVREILRLPELTLVEEAPAHVVGVFNLRGAIVPVMDLCVLFGYKAARYGLSDGLIVLEAGSSVAGVVINEVVDMMELPTESIQPLPEFGQDRTVKRRVVDGEAKAGDELVMALNLESLMCAMPVEGAGLEHRQATGAIFCPDASDAERKAFRSRANNLGKAAADTGVAHLTAVAVVALNNEYFGVDLDSVREFAGISALVPVPCSPRHILGSMNLRGNVLTIIDIRVALNMQSASKAALKKAIVVEARGFIAGVGVDEVFEVLYINGREIKPSESVVQYDDGYIKGTIPYDGRMIAYIDLRKLLLKDDLIVNEEV